MWYGTNLCFIVESRWFKLKMLQCEDEEIWSKIEEEEKEKKVTLKSFGYNKDQWRVIRAILADSEAVRVGRVSGRRLQHLKAKYDHWRVSCIGCASHTQRIKYPFLILRPVMHWLCGAQRMHRQSHAMVMRRMAKAQGASVVLIRVGLGQLISYLP